MMNLQKKFLLLLTSLLVCFPAKKALNCSDILFNDELCVMHFFRDILEFNDLNKFIYDLDYNYHPVDFSESQLSEADVLNVQEWKVKMNNKEITDKDIISFLYDLSPTAYWKNQEAWDNNNRFLHHAKTKQPEIYTYLQLLKKVALSVGDYNPVKWGDNDEHPNYGYASNITPDLETLLQKTKDPFLKRRCAYKLITLGYYEAISLGATEINTTSNKNVGDLFEKYFIGQEKDWLYYSAMHYYGAVKGKDFLLEAFIYGKDKRSRSSDLLGKEYINQTIEANKDPKKVAACIAIQAMHNPGPALKQMKKIYTLDPQNRDLKFLVTREMNKLENWLWTKKISGLKPDSYYSRNLVESSQFFLNYKHDIVYSKKVLAFLAQLQHNKTMTEQDELFYTIATTYTCLLQGNYQAAIATLNKKPCCVENPKYRLQVKVIKIMVDMYVNGPDNNFENRLLALLDEIKSCKSIELPMLYFHQLTRTVAEYYKTIPEFRAKGFLLNSRNNLLKGGTHFMDDIYINASTKDIDHILDIIRKKSKNNFEDFITKGMVTYCYEYYEPCDEITFEPFDTLRLIDYKGMKLMRKDNLEAAYKLYATLSDSILNTEPFSYVRDDVFIFRYNPNNEFIYNKKTFLAQLIAYKKSLAKNPNDPLINYYVGNAYLNMTRHGNAWTMLNNYVTSNITDEAYAQSISHHYIYADLAVPYFKKALANVKDKKLKVLLQINLGYIKTLHIENEKKQLHEIKKLCTGKDEKQLLEDVFTNCDLYSDYTSLYAKKGPRIAGQYVWSYNY